MRVAETPTPRALMLRRRAAPSRSMDRTLSACRPPFETGHEALLRVRQNVTSCSPSQPSCPPFLPSFPRKRESRTLLNLNTIPMGNRPQPLRRLDSRFRGNDEGVRETAP